MSYDKGAIFAAGEKLAALVLALADGVGADDLDEGTEFLVSIAGQAPSFIEDLDAAALALLSGLCSALSDAKRDPVPV